MERAIQVLRVEVTYLSSLISMRRRELAEMQDKRIEHQLELKRHEAQLAELLLAIEHLHQKENA